MTEKRTVVTSVNLPVESILTVLDVDNPAVEIGIEDAMKEVKSGSLRSMNTTICVNNYSEMQNPRTMDLSNIDIDHDTFQITKIERKKIEKTNALKFFKASVEFANGIKKEFIVPSFVKFYSSKRRIIHPS